jgi:RNA 3'-terminal phosphate cyclase (ATP)
MQCPSLEFLTEAFLPQIAKMGVGAKVLLERRGFHPVGGGRWALEISPVKDLNQIELLKRGPRRSLDAEILVSQLGTSIAKREAKVIARALKMDDPAINIVEDTHALGPGNALQVFARFDHVTEVFTGLGKLGVQAETIAKRLGKATNRYLNSKAAVGHYLADQLLLPMALAGGGRFTTMRPSLHTMTNIATIQKFLDVTISVDEGENGLWTIEIKK